jgi:regulator of RNase E activity RraA
MGRRSEKGPPSAEVLEKLRGASCATLWSFLGDVYHMEHVKPLMGDVKIVGPAVTVAYAEVHPRATPEQRARERNRFGVPMHDAWDVVKPGDVIVGAGLGNINAGIFGDCLATGFTAKGAIALVSDASVRDYLGIKEAGIPAFTRGPPTPLSSSGGGIYPVDVNINVVCDGVTVKPGDIIVGDGDGIVVVPRELAEEVAEKANAKEKLEATSRKLLLEGKPLRECYPHLKKEYVKEHGLKKYWNIIHPEDKI